MTDLSFRQLLLRLALLPILCICGFMLLLGLQLRDIARHRLLGAQATSVLLESNLLQKSLIDEETGVRGYLASSERSYLQPYEEGRSREGRELSELEEETTSNPPMRDNVAAIAASARQFNEINDELLNRRELTEIERVSHLENQKAVMDGIRAQFANLNSAETEIREKHRTEISRLFKRLPAALLISGILLSATLLWYGKRLYDEITDAFETKLTEAQIQRDSLKTTLHSIGDGVIVCDSRGSVKMLNPAASVLTGWTEGEAIGHPLADVFQIVHEQTRATVESPFEKVIRLDTVIALANHTVLIQKDGGEIPIDDSGAPIRDKNGALFGVVLVFRSVLERRQAATALKESRERLESIYNTSLEYVSLLDPSGTLLDTNRASLTFEGSKREEVIGKPFWDCPWFQHTEGMREQIREAVDTARAGQPTRTQLALTKPSGEVVDFDFSLGLVLDSFGKVRYLVPEARDITELRRTQAALIRSEKLAAVGRLAASIAHEINNPLEAVTNLLYLAARENSLETVRNYIDSANYELARVSAITTQTLRFHRQASRPDLTSPEDLIETILSVHEGRIKGSNISVEGRHSAQEPILVFAGDVRQVLNNLISNAIEAMNGANRRLLIRSRSSHNWRTSESGIVFIIADTGSGINPGDLKNIFEPFFTTKGESGNGLGLWVSRQIAERHSGTLKVRSSTRSDCSWTVFRLFLPSQAH